MPLQRTSFIGREQELAQGAELLERSRLLTLTGAPGSGKTRLALRLAADRRSDFPHGSFFVPLAAITDPRRVDGAVARTLGLREVQGETALESIKAFLRDRRVLLTLDNFEQVLEAAAQVGELLDAAPDLTIVVTSRAPLGLIGEQEFPVPPLSIPSIDDLPDLEALAAYDAVALFVARAQAAEPDFALDTGNAAAVAEIAARLDGLPLAIELAAARVKLLTPQDLLSRLEQRLALLTGGPTDVVDRHRTMRNSIDWSHELLEPEERVLFRRLGVFVGGFTLEAATAVADLPDVDIFDGVGSLLSRSLLYRPVDLGQARFVMLEMMREFALEQLDSAGEKEEVAKRHAYYFCHVAEETEPELTRETQRTAMGLFSQELDNIRAALRFALDADDPDVGLSLASCIWRFWQSSGQLSEGRQWLESLLASQGASDPARAKGLSGLAGLAYWQGDYREALTRYEEALDLYRAVGDRFNEAETLFGLSMAATWNGDPDTGERLAGEARSVFEGLGAKEGIGKVHMAQAFSLHRKGDLAAARPLWQAALGISRELGDQHLAITQLIGLAMCVFEDGDVGEALSIALEAVNEATDAENVQLAVWMLDFVAAFAASAAPEGAVRVAGAVEALRQQAGGGMPLAPLDLEDARSVAARVLSPESLDQAWAEGRAMTLDQAVECAKELERLISDLSTS
jgi:predicted ATPase